MKIEQTTWTQALGWHPQPSGALLDTAQLVLAFAAPDLIRNPGLVEEIRRFYPQAIILGCSSAGEICGPHVLENSIVVTALQFDRTLLGTAHINLTHTADSIQAGEQLAIALPPTMNNEMGEPEKLAHVLLLTEGLDINGSDLITGLLQQLPAGVSVTGGLAGDGLSFKETLVFAENVPSKHTVTAVGLYGSQLRIGFGSLGGWDPFGPERVVTKSKKNILYELDNRPALALYKQYLGEHASRLPASGLFFPLCIRSTSEVNAVVRTFLTFDEEAQSMTFSGNIPQGAYARLMKCNPSSLIHGASSAAKKCARNGGADEPELAILISCVARKLVLTQRTEEEVEAVSHILGPQAVLTGFYSYGEMAPFESGGRCELHNQTMTITTISEG
ncbi:MAG: hypothetical protein B9S32_01770 [Verrucomicrobia bacterium Tous-C9LFEB]|nr:MAG: hypothetical protein B9S32_01770 [Verrucomicrobia bacterium Tous-C9LFEB]